MFSSRSSAAETFLPWGSGSLGGSSVRSIRHYAPTTSGIELDVPEPPMLTSPAAGAVGITTATPFVWSPLGGVAGVCMVEIRSPNGWIRVVTSETTTTIPEVPGYEIPADMAIDWTVLCYAPFAGVDGFAAPEADVDIPEFRRIVRVRSDMQYGSASRGSFGRRSNSRRRGKATACGCGRRPCRPP